MNRTMLGNAALNSSAYLSSTNTPGVFLCRQNKVDKCGKCQLPQLRRLQSTRGNPSLGIVEDADVLLLFRTAKNSEASSRRLTLRDASCSDMLAIAKPPLWLGKAGFLERTTQQSTLSLTCNPS